MANLAKYNRGQIGCMTQHYDRSKDNGEYVKFRKNQDIDPHRSHLNYNLAPERDGGQLGFIAQRCAEVKCSKREDVNVMCSWVITAPKGLSEEEIKPFFQEAYFFLNDRYTGNGRDDKNVISAWVHMDETTPHMHYAFIPVVQDKKKGHDKVSAKELVNRTDLQSFHGELEAHMTAIFGREVGILNEATKDGNKTTQELKKESAIAEGTAAIEAVKSELAKTRVKIEGKLAGAKLISRAQENMKEGGGLFGGEKSTTLKGISAEDTLKILKAASERDAAVKHSKVANEKAIVAQERLKGITEREATAKEALAHAGNVMEQAIEVIKLHEGLPERYTAAVEEKNKLQDKLKEDEQLIAALRGQIAKLTAQKEIHDKYHAREVNALNEQLEGAYTSLRNVVQAAGVMIHSKDSEYAIVNPTEEQRKLLNTLADYAEKWARNDGFEEIAEEIKKSVGISDSIQNMIDPPEAEPTVKAKKRDHERG